LRAVVKARQIGFSTVLAIETCHSACTQSGYLANIVSVNQEEASDKLRTASALWASIPPEMEPFGFKPVKFRDAEDALAFHMPPHTSTIISKPGTHAVRGSSKSVYFDEGAFIEKFKVLYQAAVPATLRGDNRTTVISTPMGESGLFYEIATNEDQFPGYSKHVVPWWHSRYMVKEGALLDAINLAPNMGTKERVQAFGTDKLKLVFANSGDLVTFQTEMECMFVDETEAFFPWELVVTGKDEAMSNTRDFELGAGDEISIGVDLAKKRDQTVFTVVQHINGAGENDVKYRVRYIYETQAEYEEQYEMLKALIKRVGAKRVSIDQTGVGAMFVERAQREGFGPGVMVEGIVFNPNNKEKWATTFKGDLQRGRVKYPPYNEALRQINGIRRKKSETNFYRFAGEKDDIFWSMMLGLYGAGHEPVRFHLLGA
jgi:phage FluMu gp28-like protein